MATRQPAPVFAIPAIDDDEEIQRPHLSFPLPRRLLPATDGEVPVYEKSRRQLFQVKLDSEIPIGGFVEIARVQVEFEALLTARANMNLLEYSTRMRDCCIRFIGLWMFDYVPDEIIENLTQDSLEKAVDFLFGLMPKDAQEMAKQERERLQALAA